MSGKNSPRSVTSTNISPICGLIDHAEINARLRAFEKKTGRVIVQENGQRKYSPPPEWKGPEPPRGCEVFIGKLPRRMYEDEIIPLFESVAPLYQFRLMMDFAGTNRGFAFAKYTNRADAKKAIAKLDNYEIKKDQHIGVVMSVENCRLYLGHIPRNKTCDEVREEICKLTEGVVQVILYPNFDDRTKNRGFAFVEYVSHQAATSARRKLVPPGHVTMWNVPIEVDWAEPEQEPDEETIAKVKNLYVRNLMPHTTEADLKLFFEKITGSDTVEHVKKMKDFAFVHFKNKNDATLALQQSNGTELDGSKIEVVWAKPVDPNLKRLRNLQMTANGSGSQDNFVPSHHAHASALLTSILPPTTFASATNFGTYLPAPAPGHIIFTAQPTACAPTAGVVPRFLYGGTSNLNVSNQSDQIPVNIGPLNPSSLASLAGSTNAMPYAGFPFIDPMAGNLAQANNHRQTSNRIRSAAGMRSAGYQNAMNNACASRIRKKFTESLNVNDSIIATSQTLPTNSLASNTLFFMSPQPVATTFAAPRFSCGTNVPSTTAALSLINAVTLRPQVGTSPLLPKHFSQQQYTNENVMSPPSLLPQQKLSPSSSLSPLSSRGYCQLLEDYCRQNKCAKPEYQIITITTKDLMSNDVLLYVCKVTIANFVAKYGAFEARDPSATIDEAQENAAKFALLSLGYNFNEQNDQGSTNHFIYPQIVHSTGLIPFVVHSDIPTFYTTTSTNILTQNHQPLVTPQFNGENGSSCLQQISSQNQRESNESGAPQQHIIQQAA